MGSSRPERPEGEAPGSPTSPAHPRRAELILLAVTAAWGLTFPVIKDALTDVSPFAFVALRFSIAALLLAPLLAGRLRITDRWAARAGIFLGLLFAAGFALQTLGLERTTAAKSGFFTGTAVIFVPALSWIFERRRPPAAAVIGALLAIAGIGLLTRPESMRINVGDLLTLACAVVFGLEVVTLQILSRRHGPWPLIWPAVATTAVIAAGFSILEPARVVWTPRLLTAIAFASVVATAGALVLHIRWQKETTSVRAGLIYSTEPLFALLFAALLLGERMPPASLVGGAAIIAGVVITELARPAAGPRRGP
jgi:drug/metabolite transporter (DMT)-like permease